MDEKAQFLEERIPELDSFVEELNILAKLTGQQLRVHFPLKSRMPGLAHVLHPLLAHPSDAEQLRRRQKGKDMLDKQVTRDTGNS